MQHIPVLAQEVMGALTPASGGRYLDATLGAGGHASMILQLSSPDGQLVGFDRDARNLAIAKEHLGAYGDRVRFIQDSYANMSAYDLPEMDGILFDLGYSSMHVDQAERGFSFQEDGPLDMRYDLGQMLTAEMIVNEYTRDDLSELIYKYGEEPFSRQIAKAIVEQRKRARIRTTLDLAKVIETVVRRVGKHHPATKTFQALRIVVNDEFGHMERGLSNAVNQLKIGGVIAVISFHSLEDRIVKQFFKTETRLELMSKKAIQPTWREKQHNKRSRSAKLRIARRQS